MPIIFEVPLFVYEKHGIEITIGEYDFCSLKIDNYKLIGFHSVTKEFELICDKAYLRGLIQTLFFSA